MVPGASRESTSEPAKPRAKRLAADGHDGESSSQRHIDAMTKAQPYCCVGMLPCTMYCMQCKLRYDILKTLGNGMDDYICCQGYFPPCCCFHPGHCGEKCV